MAVGGLDYLRRAGLFNPSTGMWANLRLKLVNAEAGATVVEGEVDASAHGSAGGATIHRGVVATVADCALASAAATLVDEGQGTATVDIRVEYLRSAQPGTITGKAHVIHRVQDLVFCEATVEQDDLAVAHANGTIAVISTT
jgi:uncharacterized protein (TIGR00369 family)